MSKSRKSYEELRAIAEYCFLFPQLSTMNEEFVGEFMFNHEAVAADLHKDENRKQRSDRTIRIMEDVNALLGLLSLRNMTMSEITDLMPLGLERMNQAMDSMKKQRLVDFYMMEQTRYFTAVK